MFPGGFDLKDGAVQDGEGVLRTGFVDLGMVRLNTGKCYLSITWEKGVVLMKTDEDAR